MERHQGVQYDDAELLKTDWKEEVKILAEYEEHRDEILYMISDFQITSDGNIGIIRAAIKRIELKPDQLSSDKVSRWSNFPTIWEVRSRKDA